MVITKKAPEKVLYFHALSSNSSALFLIANQSFKFVPLQDEELSGPEKELQELKESLQDTQPVGVLINAAKTLDQVGGIMQKGP